MLKPTRLSRQIIYLNFVPLILLVLIVVAIMLYIYFKRLSILESVKNAVYTQQKKQLIGIVAALSAQIQQKFQYASIQVMAVGRFNELSLFEDVPVNTNFQIQPVNTILFLLNKENHTIVQQYHKKTLQFEQWYWKNSINYSQLSQDQQELYQNTSYYGCIMHAVQLANIYNTKNLAFSLIARNRQEDGFLIVNEASLNSIQQPINIPVSWIPSDYCSPGIIVDYDPRCTPEFYLSINSSIPDGLNIIPLEASYVFKPPLLKQSLIYKQFQPVPGQSGAFQSYSQQAAAISINSIQDLLLKYLENYNFLLFYSTTYQMVYYNAINGSDYQSIPTLQSAWLDQMSDDQQNIFLNAIPQSWSAQKYQQNVTVVPKDLVSFSNQVQDLPRVEVEYQINASTYFSIMQQIQVYAKSRTTSSIDNFFTISANFNKDDLLKDITSLDHKISLQTSYQLLAGLIILIAVLIAAYIFSKNFARSIEEPIDKLAKLLAVIDASYLQNINSNPVSKQENVADSRMHSSIFKSQNEIQTPVQLNDQSIEKKLQKILDNLVTNEEVRVLHQSLTYIFQLIKYANQEFWSGNHDMALIKMADALSIYKSLGNTTAQISCTFNISNIHFTRARWDQAIAACTNSLALVNQQLEEAKNQEASPPHEQSEHLLPSNLNKTILSNLQINTDRNNLVVIQNVNKLNKKVVDEKEKIQHKQINSIQKELKQKINSLLQKKFDRLYYILQATIHKYLSNHLLKDNGTQLCQDLLKMLDQVCEEMGSVCQCLQFIVIYSKAIVAIYSQQLETAKIILLKELQKIAKNTERPAICDNQKNTVVGGHSFLDEQKQSLRSIAISSKSQAESVHYSKNCQSQYYHVPDEIVYQKIAYLEALLHYRQGKRYLAMNKLVTWLESSDKLDRYQFYLIEQLAKKITNFRNFSFSSSDKTAKTINLILFFDSTQYLLSLSESIEQIRSSIKKCMVDIKGKMSVYLKCRAIKNELNIVHDQTIEWVTHHWRYMRQILIKESLKDNKNYEKVLNKDFYPKLMQLAEAESQAIKLQKSQMIFLVVTAQEPDTRVHQFIPILKQTGSKLIYYCEKENLQLNQANCRELSIVYNVDELHRELEGLFDKRAFEQPILIESL